MKVIVNNIEKELTYPHHSHRDVDCAQDLVDVSRDAQYNEDGILIMSQEDYYYWAAWLDHHYWAAWLDRHSEQLKLIQKLKPSRAETLES